METATPTTARMSKRAMLTLWKRADEAGDNAARAKTPQPMAVQQHANVLDDSSPVVKQWHVPEGVCGFAFVHFKGNTRFGRWARTQFPDRVSRDSYHGGYYFGVWNYGQSYERKDAYARAFVRVLNDGGIADAWAESRLD